MTVKKEFGSFSELLQSADTPTLVDFYAPWCGPCQLMTGILEQTKTKLQGAVQIVKINTDNYPDLASAYQVSALPTLSLFKDGEPIDRVEGVIPADKLCDRIQSRLA